MRECTVEQSTIVYRVSFGRMLPWLPTPGTTGFASLSRALGPHGLSPVGIELDAPSSRLDDVVLTLSLLANRLKAKLSYGWLEFIVSDLYEGDESALIEIANQLIGVLHEIDVEMMQDSAQYRSYGHLKLAPSEAKAFIGEHLRGNDSSDLIPDAFAYDLRWNELKEGEQARVVVAKSSRFDDGLFIDLTINYRLPSEPLAMVERMNQDYDRVLNLLGLQLRS